ncbi:MAG: hypothetical protein E4H27_10135 [Anaerolineales bacterium]|nr:MAG: hypothetical protein E4H27_10135 [Anaerolineales bacterium]
MHPIALARWIVKPAKPDDPASKATRRKSPRKGQPLDIFAELVSFPALIDNPNFTIEVLYTREEEVRKWDEKRMWRRKGWATDYKTLLEVVDRQVFTNGADFLTLLPSDLPATFTTADLANACQCPLRLSQRIAYCFKVMGLFQHIGMQGRGYLYQITDRDVAVGFSHSE